MKLYKLWSEWDIGEDMVIFPSEEAALEWGYNSLVSQYDSEQEMLSNMDFESKEEVFDYIGAQEVTLIGVLPP